VLFRSLNSTVTESTSRYICNLKSNRQWAMEHGVMIQPPSDCRSTGISYPPAIDVKGAI